MHIWSIGVYYFHPIDKFIMKVHFSSTFGPSFLIDKKEMFALQPVVETNKWSLSALWSIPHTHYELNKIIAYVPHTSQIEQQTQYKHLHIRSAENYSKVQEQNNLARLIFIVKN